jgi:hypothetical protein
MIGSEIENELALDNVAGIHEPSQSGGGPKSGSRAEDWRKNGDREYEYEYEYDSS